MMPKTSIPAAGEAMPAADMNRRRLMKGVAAVTATGTMACSASAGIPANSKLSALIEAHRSAYEAFDTAIGREWEAEEHYKQNCTKGRMTEVRNGLWQEIDTCYVRHWSEYRESAREAIAREYDRLRSAVPSALSDDLRSAAITELNRGQRTAYRRLAIVINDIAAEQDALGLTEAIEALESLCQRERDAALALMSYRCETIEECRLKGAYVAECSILKEALHGSPELLDALLSSFLTEGRA